MQYLSFDFLVIYAFLAITIVVGFRASRGIVTVQDYVLGNRRYGKWTVLFSNLATTFFGGTILTTAAITYSKGIIHPLSLLGYGILLTYVAYFVAPAIAAQRDCLTLGDIISKYYGANNKIIAGILGFITAICRAGMDLIIIGAICEKLLNIPAGWGIILFGVTLAIYTAHGGIRGVAATDVFQFLVLMVFIPMLIYAILNKTGGAIAVFEQLPPAKLQILDHPEFGRYATDFAIWALFPLSLSSNPALIQRMLMAKNGEVAKEQTLLWAVFDPLFRLSVLFIGIAGFVLYPHITASDVVPQLIQDLLPTGLKGLAVAGLLAITMSTIDSYLHAAGFTLVHDVIKPFYDRKNKPLAEELAWMRWVTALVSIVAMAIGLLNDDSYKLLLIPFGFVAPFLMFPVLSAVMGLKVDKLSFQVNLVAVLLAFFINQFWLFTHQQHLVVLFTVLTSAIAFFGTHWVVNGGFSIVDCKEDTVYLWRPKQAMILGALYRFLPIPSRLVTYAQENVKKYGASYIAFGLFCMFQANVPYFIFMELDPMTGVDPYETVKLYIRIIGGVMGVILVAHERWPLFRKYLPLFYYAAILFCIPFTGTIMFLLSKGAIGWLVSIMAYILLLFILLDGFTACFIGLLGVTGAFLCQHLWAGEIVLQLTLHAKFLIFYQICFGLVAGLMFARRKQQRMAKLFAEKEALVGSDKTTKETLLEAFKEKLQLLQILKQAGISQITHIAKLINALKLTDEGVVKDPALLQATLMEIQDAINPMATTLAGIESRATDYLRLSIHTTTIEKLLADIEVNFPGFKLFTHQDTNYQQMITCDTLRMQQLFRNAVHILSEDPAMERPYIYLRVDNTQLVYPLTSVTPNVTKDKRIPAMSFTIGIKADLPTAADSYDAQIDYAPMSMPETPKGLLIITNRRIIKAHYGYTNLAAPQGTEIGIQRYVIPVDITQIRPRDMDNPEMELGAKPIRANDRYPGAQEKEKAFLADVKRRSGASMENLKRAIEVIKQYHGSKNRRSGEPFYLHPLAVAHIVLDFSQEEEVLLAALLHDTVEYTPMIQEGIEGLFGSDVASIVQGITHFESKPNNYNKIKLSPEENETMILAKNDNRILYVKIADRLHNMRTIDGHKTYEKQRTIAEETLKFYVPLAAQLGLQAAAKELQMLSEAVLKKKPS